MAVTHACLSPDFSKALAASPPSPPGWLLDMPVACCPLLAGLWPREPEEQWEGSV